MIVFDAGFLIMLVPHKFQPLSSFAYDILEKFGIASYPFTLEKAVIAKKPRLLLEHPRNAVVCARLRPTF